MSIVNLIRRNGLIKKWKLLLFAYATAFFPRLFTSLGAPSVINFAHFGVVIAVFLIVIATSKKPPYKNLKTFSILLVSIFIFLFSNLASGFLNSAGAINVFLQFMMQVEPFLLLAAFILVPLSEEEVRSCRKWLLYFALFNLILAIIQSILLPIGLYPKPVGGTLQDNITGVFGAGGGSAGNYVSCTISFYFSLYFFISFKKIAPWILPLPLIASFYQIMVSDSKQVFLALAVGALLLIITKLKSPNKFIPFLIIALFSCLLTGWALLNLESEFLASYQNWINRPIWGFNGLASQTKFAAFSIVPSYFTTPLHFLFGLGPGHTATRLGGWFMESYANLLIPLGATTHPASSDFWAVINNTYLPQESTIFFPMYTWIGIWGDLGIVGLISYLYLCSIAWTKIIRDDFGRFLLLSTAAFGFILTQMEEPGQLLTVSCLLALRWQEVNAKNYFQINDESISKLDVGYRAQ